MHRRVVIIGAGASGIGMAITLKDFELEIHSLIGPSLLKQLHLLLHQTALECPI